MKLGCLFGSEQCRRVNCPLAMKCCAVNTHGLRGSDALGRRRLRSGRDVLQWRSEQRELLFHGKTHSGEYASKLRAHRVRSHSCESTVLSGPEPHFHDVTGNGCLGVMAAAQSEEPCGWVVGPVAKEGGNGARFHKHTYDRSGRASSA